MQQVGGVVALHAAQRGGERGGGGGRALAALPQLQDSLRGRALSGEPRRVTVHSQPRRQRAPVVAARVGGVQDGAKLPLNPHTQFERALGALVDAGLADSHVAFRVAPVVAPTHSRLEEVFRYVKTSLGLSRGATPR